MKIPFWTREGCSCAYIMVWKSKPALCVQSVPTASVIVHYVISWPSTLNALLTLSNVIVAVKCSPNHYFWCPASIASSSIVHLKSKWVFCVFSPWCQLMYHNEKEEGKSHDSWSFLLFCTEQCLKRFTEGTKKLTKPLWKLIPLFVLDFSTGIAVSIGRGVQGS